MPDSSLKISNEFYSYYQLIQFIDALQIIHYYPIPNILHTIFLRQGDFAAKNEEGQAFGSVFRCRDNKRNSPKGNAAERGICRRGDQR